MLRNTKRYQNPVAEAVSEVLAIKLGDAMRMNQDPMVGEKLRECYNLVVGLDNYLDHTASEETPVQRHILTDTYNKNWEDVFRAGKISYNAVSVMASGYLEGQFLRVASQMAKARRILEIGTFTGYGAVSLAQSDHCEEMVCLDYQPYFRDFLYQRIFGTPLEKKMNFIVGVALESLQMLKNQGKVFDLIFIDADKSNYIHYYDFIMNSGLLEKYGTILVDNTLWKGETFPHPTSKVGKYIHDFNEHVRLDERVNQVILPLNDGVTLIHRKEEYPA